MPGAKGASLPKGKPSRLVGLKGDSPQLARIMTGIGELDRVAGGGFVPGSGVLIGRMVANVTCQCYTSIERMADFK